MAVAAEYISCGCNRTPHAADWGPNNLIIYATCRSVAVYDPQYSNNAGIVLETIACHSARVNSVRWIKGTTQSGTAASFVSSSSDKTCVLYSHDGSNFMQVSKPMLHDDIVNIADGITVKDRNGDTCTYIASATANSKLYMWLKKKNSDEIQLIQTLDLNRGFVLDIRFTFIEASNALVLALAGDDSTIKLFAFNEDDSNFSLLLKLVGHEDWVRGLDFTTDDNGDILLASCSQDCLVRIWRITDDKPAQEDPDEQEIKLKRNMFSVSSAGKSHSYYVILDTVLTGHENWVYGVHWHPPVCNKDETKARQPMTLLTSSMDKTMIIWSLDESSGIWLDCVRVGEVGGNTLGFYGSKFSPDGLSIFAHGYQGAFHIWHQSEIDKWVPGVTVSGHFAETQDLVWDTEGNFLLSTSTDQTTRLHAPWVQENNHPITWHEIARPQVHGYDMTCLAITEDYKLISGADEKVMRAFQPPTNFIENLKSISKVSLDRDFSDLPEGANVPSLGLSNKAVFHQNIVDEQETEERHPKDMYPEIYFRSVALNSPPTEEHLLQNTLWPEIQKLYGHGYELFCLAVNHKYDLIASACKASQAEHAAIIIWDIKTWQPVGRLMAHKLTVTQLAFSPDDNFLLSVSRDRTWAVYEVGIPEFKFVAKSDKDTTIHSRIIWSCAWTFDCEYFLTASRDKKVVIWGNYEDKLSINPLLNGYFSAVVVSDFVDSVTSVCVAPTLINDKYLIATGLENGSINLHTLEQNSELWSNITTINTRLSHNMTVKRLRFRPTFEKSSEDGQTVVHLASCSSDFSVRIFRIKL